MTMTSLFLGLIISKTRIRILMRLFMNPQKRAYMRELSDEFCVSSSQIKDELNLLSDADFLTSKKNGRQILFSELNSMVRKALGMDRVIDSIVDRLGNLEKAFLLDDYAEGKHTGIMDLLLIGDINQRNLQNLVQKTERYIGRKIRTLVLGGGEGVYGTPGKIGLSTPVFTLGTSSDNHKLSRKPRDLYLEEC